MRRCHTIFNQLLSSSAASQRFGVAAAQSVAMAQCRRRLATDSTAAAMPAMIIDPVQAGYLEEPCIRVNQRDEPLGPVSKRNCHAEPILHRAFSVFCFDTDNRLILQKRSQTKITFPGLWTNTCCSHPHFVDEELSGEEGTKRAAKRKLRHELGIDVEPFQMHIMGRFIYKAASDNAWMEHELDYAICVPKCTALLNPNPDEVAEVKYVTQSELANMFAEPNSFSFSPWFTLFHSYRWLTTWWNNANKLEPFKDPITIHQLN